MGLIIRTAGAARTKQEIKRDFEYEIRLWENVRDLTLQSTAPCLVYEEGNLIKRSIRDLYSKDIDEILVAGEAAHKEAYDFMRMLSPSQAKSVVKYEEPEPLFARYQIERQLNAMFSPYVTLRSGGYLVINQTEALVSVDVNSGKATREFSIEETALNTNLEASDEIARQLKLSDLAGLIVIDFIDMEERRNNRKVENRLKDALRHDRARIQVGRISHFGLMEMSRQRLRTGVLEGSTSQCPHCQGTGIIRSVESVALAVLRALEDQLLRDARNSLTAVTTADVALYILNNKRAFVTDMERRYGVHHHRAGQRPHAGRQLRHRAVGRPGRRRRGLPNAPSSTWNRASRARRARTSSRRGSRGSAGRARRRGTPLAAPPPARPARRARRDDRPPHREHHGGERAGFARQRRGRTRRDPRSPIRARAEPRDDLAEEPLDNPAGTRRAASHRPGRQRARRRGRVDRRGRGRRGGRRGGRRRRASTGREHSGDAWRMRAMRAPVQPSRYGNRARREALTMRARRRRRRRAPREPARNERDEPRYEAAGAERKAGAGSRTGTGAGRRPRALQAEAPRRAASATASTRQGAEPVHAQPAAEQAPEDPSRPARKGWWQRQFSANSGRSRSRPRSYRAGFGKIGATLHPTALTLRRRVARRHQFGAHASTDTFSPQSGSHAVPAASMGRTSMRWISTASWWPAPGVGSATPPTTRRDR